MADFVLELPDEIINDFRRLNNDCGKIFRGMTRAGAEVVIKAVEANMPESLKKSDFFNCLSISRDYLTPSDDAYNTKVIISGYFYNHKEELIPAPLVANVFEYGSTNFPKHPFFRKSFKKNDIEAAMYKAQKQLSGGLLDE